MGRLRYSQDKIDEAVIEAHRGYQAAIHAQGDSGSPRQ
jgi:hypothetical protein